MEKAINLAPKDQPSRAVLYAVLEQSDMAQKYGPVAVLDMIKIVANLMKLK